MNANMQTIMDHRDYIIENNKYHLKLVIDKQYIYFKLIKLNNDSLEYRYTNRMDLQTLLENFDLNPLNHLNGDLNLFDKINEMNNISINMNNDYSCILIIKMIDNLNGNEKIQEIELSKEYMNDNEKINILYNELRMIKESNKVGNKKEIEEMNKKINDILLNQENIIKANNINDIINKRINEIENKLINDIKNSLINQINNEINIIDNKLKDNINKIEIIDNKYKNLIKKIEKEIEIIYDKIIEEHKKDNIKINNKNNDIEIFN